MNYVKASALFFGGYAIIFRIRQWRFYSLNQQQAVYFTSIRYLLVFESCCHLPPVYYTRQMLHIVPLIAERQAGKLGISIFIVFGLTRPGIEPQSTASIADALSTRPLIGYVLCCFRLALIYAFFQS